MLKYIITLAFLAFNLVAFGQKAAIVRGNVYDKANGQPVPYANVILRGTGVGSTTDLNGFFQIMTMHHRIYHAMLFEIF